MTAGNVSTSSKGAGAGKLVISCFALQRRIVCVRPFYSVVCSSYNVLNLNKDFPVMSSIFEKSIPGNTNYWFLLLYLVFCKLSLRTGHKIPGEGWGATK